jgi:ABC-type transporter Mla MlaB component
MKQGKSKKSAAESNAPAVATPALPDAAYVDQLLDTAAPTAAMANEVTSEVAATAVTGVIELPSQCLLRDAVEYRQRFLDCVDAESVSVDVGAVDRIDTAFIQVLVSFARSRAAAKRSITWQRMTSEFIASARLLGVQSTLSIPDVSDAA